MTDLSALTSKELAEKVRGGLDPDSAWNKREQRFECLDALRDRASERDQVVRERDELRGAAALLRADIACNNGCDCEKHDYCAADEWDNLLIRMAVR